MKSPPDRQHPEDRRIAEAIREAERQTSGEIRVFVSGSGSGDPSAEAEREFARLQMRRTPMRNAVLLHFSAPPHRLTVIGDEGFHLRCGQGFWTTLARETEPMLGPSRLPEAILTAIAVAGRELARAFPKHDLDRNDLPDTVVRG